MNPIDLLRLVSIGIAYILLGYLLGEWQSRKFILTGSSLICWGIPVVLACMNSDGGLPGLMELLFAVALLSVGATLIGYGIEQIRHPYRLRSGWY